MNWKNTFVPFLLLASGCNGIRKCEIAFDPKMLGATQVIPIVGLKGDADRLFHFGEYSGELRRRRLTDDFSISRKSFLSNKVKDDRKRHFKLSVSSGTVWEGECRYEFSRTSTGDYIWDEKKIYACHLSEPGGRTAALVIQAPESNKLLDLSLPKPEGHMTLAGKEVLRIKPTNKLKGASFFVATDFVGYEFLAGDEVVGGLDLISTNSQKILMPVSCSEDVRLAVSLATVPLILYQQLPPDARGR